MNCSTCNDTGFQTVNDSQCWCHCAEGQLAAKECSLRATNSRYNRLRETSDDLLAAVRAALNHFQNFTGGSVDECQTAEARLVAILEDAELKATDGDE